MPPPDQAGGAGGAVPLSAEAATILAISAAADCEADCSAVFSGQKMPTMPATSSGAAVSQLTEPAMADSIGATMIMKPWPVVMWPDQDFIGMFKLSSSK